MDNFDQIQWRLLALNEMVQWDIGLTNRPSDKAELQIGGCIEDNSKVIFLISQQKHMLCLLIRTVSARQF